MDKLEELYEEMRNDWCDRSETCAEYDKCAVCLDLYLEERDEDN